MFANLTIPTLALLLAIASTPLSLVGEVVTFLRPGPCEKFNACALCYKLIKWQGNSLHNDLEEYVHREVTVTGDNHNIIPSKFNISNTPSAVATNQDGATDGQFNFTCPDVSCWN